MANAVTTVQDTTATRMGRLANLQLTAFLGTVEGAVGAAELLAFGLMALSIFGFNVSAAVMLCRYGLLGPVILRVGNYLVWHIFYGTLFL